MLRRARRPLMPNQGTGNLSAGKRGFHEPKHWTFKSKLGAFLVVSILFVLCGFLRIESIIYHEFQTNTRRTEQDSAVDKALRHGITNYANGKTSIDTNRLRTIPPMKPRNGLVPRSALRVPLDGTMTFDHIDVAQKKYKRQQQQERETIHLGPSQSSVAHQQSLTTSKATVKSTVLPRVVYWTEGVTVAPKVVRGKNSTYEFETSNESPLDASIQRLEFERAYEEECEPILSPAVTRIHPNCNSIHELSLTTSETESALLSMKGSWRSVWKMNHHHHPVDFSPHHRTVSDRSTANQTSIVVKLLHLHRDFDEASFQAHATDSIVMDLLTASPYVINAYGFCGQSVVTEFAESTGRDYVKRYDIGSRERLKVARDLARGLADIQSLTALPHTSMVANTSAVVERGYESNVNKAPIVFAHNDITIANTAMVHGRIKWNDFNIGVFLRKKKSTSFRENQDRRGRHGDKGSKMVSSRNESFVPFTEANEDPIENICPSPVKFKSDMWRSPEEIRNTSYVQVPMADIYGLGNILYQTMTRHQPWTYKEPGGALTKEAVAAKKLNGTTIPTIPEQYLNTTKRELQSLFASTNLCFFHDPRRRPKAHRLAYGLGSLYNKLKRKERVTRQLILEYLVAPS